MKIKRLFWALMAISALVALSTSCGGTKTGTDDETEVVTPLAIPDDVDDALLLELIPEDEVVKLPLDEIKSIAKLSNTELSVFDAKDEFEIKEIAILPGKKANITLEKFMTKASVVPPIVISTTWSKSGAEFNIVGFGKLTVSVSGGNATLKLTLTGGKVVNSSAKVVASKFNYTSATEIANLLRPLKVDKTNIEVTGGNLSATVGKIFTGCDFNEMADYAIGKGVKFDKDKIESGLKVDAIYFDIFGNVTVTFTGHSPYKGTVSSITKNAISGLSWLADTGNVFLKNPTLTYQCKGKNITITAKSKVVNGSNSYDCTVEFELSAK